MPGNQKENLFLLKTIKRSLLFINIISLLVLSSIFISSCSEVKERKLSPVFYSPGQVTDSLNPTPGYVLFAPADSTTTYLIDKHGQVIHTWQSTHIPGMSVYLLENGNLLRAENLGPTPKETYCLYPGGRIVMYDWNSNVIWADTIYNSEEQQTHDIYPMPNGNVLVNVWEKITNKEAYKAGRDTLLDTSGYFWSGRIVELQPDTATHTAKEIWHWRFMDHVVSGTIEEVKRHPKKLNINYLGVPMGKDNEDWTHMNAVTYNPDLDQIMISSRNLSEIYIIKHTNDSVISSGKEGDFLYRWGNPQAYGMGDSTDQQLFGQHSPYWIEPGFTGSNQIMINNDGFHRTYTSVNIINPLDKEGHYIWSEKTGFGPDSAGWTYKAPVSLYSNTRGSAQRLSNGNTLICAAQESTFYEIDKSEKIVWTYVLKDNGGAFRCHQYDIPFVQNIIEKEKLRLK
jgi:hypothetical protein